MASSRVAAAALREIAGRDCPVLPEIVVPRQWIASGPEPRYLTFVDPTVAHGVFAFARIADELGRRRPDIPILVVEGQGAEATVAGCGLELRDRGNVFFLPATDDPRRYLRVTRALLMPTLGWDGRGIEAIGAMLNGVPVIASDCGALPEIVGQGGVILPLPDRISPATAWFPSAEEVAPWVEATIRLWDDEAFYRERCREAEGEARRWSPEVVIPRYQAFLATLAGVKAEVAASPRVVPPGRAKSVVLVPHLNGIEWECEQSLRKLEEAGVRVVRSEGSSQIDVARNRMISDALHDGFESVLFIDADVGFGPIDALRLLARPEPVISGVYAKKGRREMGSKFAEGIDDILFGDAAPGPYPLKYAATGFLRIRASVLRSMIAALGLPLCDTRWGRGIWPFFQPLIGAAEDGSPHYLGEDWSFSRRLAQIGVTPTADTTIRLWHYGRHAYGWEDAGADRRHPSYRYTTSAEALPLASRPRFD